MPRISYVNGRYVPHAGAGVHIEDRGFQFADSVYEVIAVIGGRLADEEGHLDRLERSMAELRIKPSWTRRVLKAILREVLRRNRLSDASLYIQVTRGSAPRDFRFPDKAKASLVVVARSSNFDIEKRLAAAKTAISVPDIRWQRRDIKTTGLLAQVLAKQKAIESGAYEAVMVDEDGYVTEGSSSNFWIVTSKGKLVTRPPAGNAILKGVTRSALQSLCRKEKIVLEERPFTLKEVREAREAFITAAVALIVPIVSIDGKKIGDGNIGPVTSRILKLYMQYAASEARQFPWDPL